MESKESQYKEREAIKFEKLELDNDIFKNEERRRGRPEFFMPPGTELLKVLDYLEIDLKPSSRNKKSKRTLLMMTVMWNIFTPIMLIIGMTTGVFVVAIFFMIFQLVGLFLLWKTLGLYFNRQKITIEEQMIRITEKPFKIQAAIKEIKVSDIKQLYVSKYFTGTTVNDQKIMAYSLSAILIDNTSVRLITDSNKESALYLEQEIERFLQIKDEEVFNEILE